MATELGRFLRKLRIDKDELMKDMADRMKIASSTLSSIEMGRRNPPKGFVEKLASEYGIEGAQLDELKTAALQSMNEISMRISDMTDGDQRLAVSFARKFENLSQEDKDRIQRILNED
ncbi:MAG: helix-turn-helix transcriptional regulator [Slackia isoflavoniconvertens]|uniref:helix-turn-helix domain-containing protein n=1 Tax=Slackia isoflavoniconvertens TaxID=572010 RepID=UPI002EAC889F|nr:helix-turn-helix transcriptional regulator [Slackia isoflavoniconvertens]